MEHLPPENSSKTVEKVYRKGQFTKGQSGNPGGRPKVVHNLIELAREHTVEALETLVKIMREGESDMARANAADKILDRGYGKAMQKGELTIDYKHDRTDYTRDDLDEIIRVASAEIAAGSERASMANGRGGTAH